MTLSFELCNRCLALATWRLVGHLVFLVFTLKALHNLAQGCALRATLGSGVF
jgi:hypothetical protein